ncbi:MAG: hypothetical protein FIA97_08840 [Methylococcaceae bacterium]|nr:hypothetical protein [Methylococcaceae bacterium]
MARLAALLGVLAIPGARSWGLSADEEALRRIEQQPCSGGLTVAQVLDRTIKSHSQRDLGWRSFPGNGYVDVERAVLVNKGMELRYRWRVELQGTVGPENERAEKLCEGD